MENVVILASKGADVEKIKSTLEAAEVSADVVEASVENILNIALGFIEGNSKKEDKQEEPKEPEDKKPDEEKDNKETPPEETKIDLPPEETNDQVKQEAFVNDIKMGLKIVEGAGITLHPASYIAEQNVLHCVLAENQVCSFYRSSPNETSPIPVSISFGENKPYHFLKIIPGDSSPIPYIEVGKETFDSLK